jgi:hypothetical protein
MESTDYYVSQCITTGILTTDRIRKYPLRPSSIAVVVKAFALKARMPFEIDAHKVNEFDTYRLYLTDKGLAWLLNEFKQYTLVFLRSTFQYVFSQATPKDIENLEQYQGLNNFRGIVGVNYKAGATHPALIVREYGKNNKLKTETQYNTLVDARQELLHLTRFYPIEQFKLFRLIKTKKGTYTRSSVPLFLETNRRGVPVNLPHLKGKV